MVLEAMMGLPNLLIATQTQAIASHLVSAGESTVFSNSRTAMGNLLVSRSASMPLEI